MTGISPFERTLKNIPNLEEARKLAFEKSSHSHDLNKKHYDLKHVPHSFRVGDLVLIENHSMGKLTPRRIGPFRIIEKLSDNSYRINTKDNLRMHNIVNAHQMTPFSETYSEKN